MDAVKLAMVCQQRIRPGVVLNPEESLSDDGVCQSVLALPGVGDAWRNQD